MPATDDFESCSSTLSSPPGGGEPVTPSDSTELSKVSRSIYVGVSGHLVVVMKDGTVLTYKNLAAGMLHPIRAKRINATGTTATDIVANY